MADAIVADTDTDCLHPSGRWQRAPTDPRVDLLLARCDARRRLPVLTPTGSEPWADAALADAGTAVCAAEDAVQAALDDDAVERIVLDPGASHDASALMRMAGSVADAGVDLLVRVDDRWPASVRTLPAVRWAGVVAGHRGDWAARLLASAPAPEVRT